MKLILLCLLFVNFTLATAEIKWHEGSLVLANNEVLSGSVTVDGANHIALHLKSDSTVDVYPAHRLSKAFYFDQEKNINRRFVVIQSGRISQLAEVVLNGEVSVHRLAKFNKPCDNPDRDAFYYIIAFRGAFYNLAEFKAKIYPFMSGTFPEISDYVKSQKLNPASLADAIRISKFFNSLCRERFQLALQS